MLTELGTVLILAFDPYYMDTKNRGKRQTGHPFMHT